MLAILNNGGLRGRSCARAIPSAVRVAVQRLAGHADAVTTARYDRRGEGERRRAAGHLRIPTTGS